MICETMRERLLEAELDELAGIGSSPVAVHVRECAWCRAVAERLIADSRLLGAEIARLSVHASPRADVASRRRARRRGYLAIGTLAAAALAFVIATRSGHREVGPVAPVIADAASTVAPSRAARASAPGAPAAVSARGANADETAPLTTTMPVARSRIARPPLEHAVQPRPLPEAQPVSPTPLVPRPAPQPLVVADARSLVAVAPPPGKRAAIMRTPDPAITVVWLY